MMSKPFGLSTNYPATKTSPQNHPRDHTYYNLPELPIDSQRTPLVPSPCTGHWKQSSTSGSLVSEGTSLDRTTPTLHESHTKLRLPRRGRIITGIPPSFHSNGAVQAKSLERNRPYNGKLRGAIAGRVATVDVPSACHIPGAFIGVNGRQQEVDDSRIRCNGRVKEDMQLTPTILRDADLLLAMTPNVLDECVFYNRNWSLMDMINFNGILIDEAEIVCQWAGPVSICNERMQVKNIKTHLVHKHGVRSSLQLYSCSWNGCSARQPMTCSSIARHVLETHSFVKWVCPTCDGTFTRKRTLLGHLKKCPGDNALSVLP